MKTLTSIIIVLILLITPTLAFSKHCTVLSEVEYCIELTSAPFGPNATVFLTITENDEIIYTDTAYTLDNYTFYLYSAPFILHFNGGKPSLYQHSFTFEDKVIK